MDTVGTKPKIIGYLVNLPVHILTRAPNLSRQAGKSETVGEKTWTQSTQSIAVRVPLGSCSSHRPKRKE